MIGFSVVAGLAPARIIYGCLIFLLCVNLNVIHYYVITYLSGIEREWQVPTLPLEKNACSQYKI